MSVPLCGWSERVQAGHFEGGSHRAAIPWSLGQVQSLGQAVCGQVRSIGQVQSAGRHVHGGPSWRLHSSQQGKRVTPPCLTFLEFLTSPHLHLLSPGVPSYLMLGQKEKVK